MFGYIACLAVSCEVVDFSEGGKFSNSLKCCPAGLSSCLGGALALGGAHAKREPCHCSFGSLHDPIHFLTFPSRVMLREVSVSKVEK